MEYKCRNCKVIQRVPIFTLDFIICAFCGYVEEKKEIKVISDPKEPQSNNDQNAFVYQK